MPNNKRIKYSTLFIACLYFLIQVAFPCTSESKTEDALTNSFTYKLRPAPTSAATKEISDISREIKSEKIPTSEEIASELLKVWDSVTLNDKEEAKKRQSKIIEDYVDKLLAQFTFSDYGIFATYKIYIELQYNLCSKYFEMLKERYADRDVEDRYAILLGLLEQIPEKILKIENTYLDKTSKAEGKYKVLYGVQRQKVTDELFDKFLIGLKSAQRVINPGKNDISFATAQEYSLSLKRHYNYRFGVSYYVLRRPDGTLVILKMRPNMKQFRKKELLAYLLGNARVNIIPVAPVKDLSLFPAELCGKQGSALLLNDSLESILGIDENKLETIDDNFVSAFSRLAVFSLFIDKSDPDFMNVAFVKDVPFAFDNEQSFYYLKDESYARKARSIISFIRYYLFESAVVLGLENEDLIKDTRDNFNKNIKIIRKAQHEVQYQEKVCKDFLEALSCDAKLHKVCSSVPVNVEEIKKAIIDFKNIPIDESFKEKLREFGFAEEETPHVMEAIKQRQNILGSLVNEAFLLATGIDYELYRLDINADSLARLVVGENRPASLVLGYSPKLAENKAMLKLVKNTAGALLKNKDAFIALSYQTQKQKDNIDELLMGIDEKLRERIYVSTPENIKDFLTNMKQKYGYSVRYLMTKDEQPIKGVDDNVIMPDIKLQMVTEEFEKQFKKVVENLSEA